MVVDTLPRSVDPEPLPILSESIPLITTSPYYKYLWMDHPWPPWKPNRSNLELDPSKPFLLNFCLSLYFMFSSCFIFKLSATYIVQLYPSRDSSFSFRIPCYVSPNVVVIKYNVEDPLLVSGLSPNHSCPNKYWYHFWYYIHVFTSKSLSIQRKWPLLLSFLYNDLCPFFQSLM